MSRERYGRDDRSRERDRCHSHDRDRSRDRSPERDFDRGRDRDYERRPGFSGHTNSNDPKLLMSRVFIGNLPHEKVTREELTEIFSKYGKVLAVNILKGFGFIQYMEETDARKAVALENGSIMKGQRLDIKMAAEGKKKHDMMKTTKDFTKPDFRDRSPVRGERPGIPPPYDRHPPPRDLYDDPYRVARMAKDPYDLYRTDPYIDPYAVRDPYLASRTSSIYPPVASREPEKPPVDCEVTVADRGCSEYADAITARLRAATLRCLINVLPSEEYLTKAQEQVSKLGIPFNIVVTATNMMHRSITVRILHGMPQEHRNMPLEDAIKLVNKSFHEYLKTVYEKTTPIIDPGSLDIMPPDSEISYLLNLLMDNRFLTVDELNKLIRYLIDRRDRVIAKQQGGSVKPPDNLPVQNDPLLQQQQLQAKVLSIFGNSNSTTSTSGGLAHLANYNGYENPQSSVNVSSAAMENPQVRQALDGLLSSGLIQQLGQTSQAMTTSQSSTIDNNQQSQLYSAYGGYGGY